MFKKILVAVDVNDEKFANEVLEAAVSAGEGADLELHVLGVVPDFEMPIVAQYFPPDFEAKAVKETEQQLNALCKQSVPSAVNAEVEVKVGRVYDVIMSHANKVKADLIVLGAHAPDLKDYLVGSNARKVVAHAKQSVLVIRD